MNDLDPLFGRDDLRSCPGPRPGQILTITAGLSTTWKLARILRPPYARAGTALILAGGVYAYIVVRRGFSPAISLPPWRLSSRKLLAQNKTDGELYYKVSISNSTLSRMPVFGGIDNDPQTGIW